METFIIQFTVRQKGKVTGTRQWFRRLKRWTVSPQLHTRRLFGMGVLWFSCCLSKLRRCDRSTTSICQPHWIFSVCSWLRGWGWLNLPRLYRLSLSASAFTNDGIPDILVSEPGYDHWLLELLALGCISCRFTIG